MKRLKALLISRSIIGLLLASIKSADSGLPQPLNVLCDLQETWFFNEQQPTPPGSIGLMPLLNSKKRKSCSSKNTINATPSTPKSVFSGQRWKIIPFRKFAKTFG